LPLYYYYYYYNFYKSSMADIHKVEFLGNSRKSQFRKITSAIKSYKVKPTDQLHTYTRLHFKNNAPINIKQSGIFWSIDIVGIYTPTLQSRHSR